MTRSSEDIEREVEAVRGDLDRTVDALKDKMTPGQLIDELTRGLKGGGGGEMLGNLGAQVRENPMALAMIGAGVAWMMIGKSGGAAPAAPTSYRPPEPASFAPVEGAAGQTGHDVGPGAGAGRIGAKLGETAEAVKDGLGEHVEDAKAGLHHIAHKASAAGHSAAGSIETILQREPLIVGALGLAVGVALGAALPATSIEDKAFGAARDDLLKAGEAEVANAAHALKASGAAAVEAVKDEADRQGLAPAEDGPSLVDKAEAVVRSGVEAARNELGSDRQA